MRIQRRARQERGQATVEFVLAAPFILLILYAIIQFGMLYFNYMHVADAARTGARQAIVTRSAASAKAAAVASASSLSGFTTANVDVSGTTDIDGSLKSGTDVRVITSYPYSVNLFGIVVKSGNLTSTTTARVE